MVIVAPLQDTDLYHSVEYDTRCQCCSLSICRIRVLGQKRNEISKIYHGRHDHREHDSQKCSKGSKDKFDVLLDRNKVSNAHGVVENVVRAEEQPSRHGNLLDGSLGEVQCLPSTQSCYFGKLRCTNTLLNPKFEVTNMCLCRTIPRCTKQTLRMSSFK